MLEPYKILWQGGTGELTEKKSRFIAQTHPVESEEEAAAFIESVRKQYWDARHHCFAYVCGDKDQIQRCSDDGEPSQTAGRPILDVILTSQVHNICLVVTRYFGGTLLGTGGLVRAYSGAAKEGLNNSRILEKYPGRLVKVGTDYAGIGKVQYILGQNQIPVLDSQYTENVEISAMIPEEKVKRVVSDITECTSGKAAVEIGEEEYFSVVDGEVWRGV